MAIGDLCQGAVVGPRAHAYFSGVKRGGAEGSKRAECVCASGEGLVVWGVPECREGSRGGVGFRWRHEGSLVAVGKRQSV